MYYDIIKEKTKEKNMSLLNDDGIPLGLGMALAQNMDAMRTFSSMSERIHFLVPKASQFLQNSITIPTHLNVILYLYKANKKILDRFLFHNLPASGKDAGPPSKKPGRPQWPAFFIIFCCAGWG